MSTAETRLSIVEFNSLPDDPTIERLLIRGQLREKPMTKRNRWHADAANMIGFMLTRWLVANPGFGRAFTGDVGCDLPSIGSSFGIDVALFSTETLQQQDPKSKYLVGPPILAVEVLSPTDTQEEIRLKVCDYLDADVKVVWIVDTWFRTVVVHQAECGPEMFYGDQLLTGDPYLPGFQVRVADIFEGA